MDASFQQRLRAISRSLVLFAVYFISAKLGLRLAFVHASATAVWPPTGVALAAFLVLGTEVWPAVFLAAFLANLTTAGNVWTSLLIASGNTLEGILGAWLVDLLAGGRGAFERAQDIFKFAGLAGALAPAVGATIGVTSLSAFGYAPWPSYGAIWLTWWLGDLSGALMVAPLILLWAAKPRAPLRRKPELSLSFFTVLAAGLAVFTPWFHLGLEGLPLPFLCLPPLIWIAYRFGARETSAACLLLSALALGGTLHRVGPFSLYPPNESLLLLQSFMTVSTVMSLSLAAAVSEKVQAERNLQGARRTEEILLASEKHFRALIENASDIVTLMDEKGTILYESPSIEVVLGFEPSELIGRNAFELVHPEDVAGVVERFGLLAQDPSQTQSVSFRFRHKFKGWRELESIGRNRLGDPGVGGIVVNSRDVTEKQRAEENLRESEMRFRSLIHSSPNAIIITDSRGNILTWNQGAQAAFGYDETEMVGQPLTRIMPERYREAHILGIEKFLALGEARLVGKTAEFQGLRKDRTEFPLEITLSAWTAGGATFFGGIIRDISERKRVEELRRSNTELQQFANVASHDLQEPLRMVSNYVQLIAERYQGRLDADADEFIGFAVDGARRMQALINGLLEYARVESRGKPFQTVDLEKVLAEVTDNLRMKIRETGAEMTHDTLPQVWGDPLQLAQLLQNLFGNALKFQASGKNPRIRLSVRRKSNEWVFECRDNGIGIDPKFFDRIFVIFQRLHSRAEYEGMGMGLAICKRIAERHGGRIWVESEEGTGASFFFTLPDKI